MGQSLGFRRRRGVTGDAKNTPLGANSVPRRISRTPPLLYIIMAASRQHQQRQRSPSKQRRRADEPHPRPRRRKRGRRRRGRRRRAAVVAVISSSARRVARQLFVAVHVDRDALIGARADAEGHEHAAAWGAAVAALCACRALSYLSTCRRRRCAEPATDVGRQARGGFRQTCPTEPLSWPWRAC